MKKKLVATLSVVLILGLAVLGILAYLTSEDSDVNVMTLGNVKIEQHEYERILNEAGTYEMVTSEKYGEGYKLQDFTQAKPLYPATGAITGWGAKVPFDQIKGASGAQAVFAGLNNVQDKFVLVENTGKSDAYVRTIIALEYGSNEKDIIGISTGDFWNWNPVGVVGIDGNNYYVFEAVYKGSSTRHINGVLPAGEYTYNSLGQVYLKNEATNEDCGNLDGNKNGTYDILVLSQAVQTEGFADAATALDTAFGKTNAENVAEWFADETIPVLVSNTDNMREAMKTPGAKIVLTDDVIIDDDKGTGYALYAKYDCEIDLNGHSIKANMPGKEFYGVVYAKNGAKVDIVGDGTVEINGGVGNWIWSTGAAGATEVNIYGGNWIQNSADFVPEENYCEGIYSNREGVINIYGGMFEWETVPKYTVNESREGVVNIYGGTFVNFDPRVSHDSDGSYVADGYTVVSETQSNGDIWYTVVPK